MKNSTVLIILLFLFSCKTDNKENQENLTNQYFDCDSKITSENGNEICIPQIGGLKNAYNNEITKNFLSNFESSDYTIYSFYISKKAFSAIENLGNEAVIDMENPVNLDEYFYIFQTNNLKGLKGEESDLETLDNYFTNTYLKFEDNNISYKTAFDQIEFDKTYIIEKNKDKKAGGVTSYILISKKNLKYNNLEMIEILTPIVLNNEVYIIAYNKKFIGIPSDFEAKKRNEYIIEQLYEHN